MTDPDLTRQIDLVHQEPYVQALKNTSMSPLLTESSPIIEAPVVLQNNSHKIPTLWIVSCISFLLLCTAIYALSTKTDIFWSSTYTESNFSSGILEKISQIESAHYAFSVAFNIVPRDEDATYFEFNKTDINSGESPSLLSNIGEYVSMMPLNTKGKITLSASSEVKPGILANWSLNIDIEGTMSDVSYKMNIDALKKENNYYVRVNDFPTLFFVEQLNSIKNKWIIIPTETLSKSATTEAKETDSEQIEKGDTKKNIQATMEKSAEIYKKNKTLIVQAIKKITTSADKNQLFIFKNKPKKEKIGEQEVIRYDLSIKKEKIWPFYNTLREEIKKDPELIKEIDSTFTTFRNTDTENWDLENSEKKSDEDIKNYLESEEFQQIFDYFEKNNQITVWTDMNWMPVRVKNTSRIIPPDKAESLKNKQITIIYDLVISNINVPVIFEEPTDAISWDTVLKTFNPYKDETDETKIIAGLSTIRIIGLELYEKEKSYGENSFSLWPCRPKEDTFFANPDVVEVLNDLTHNNMSRATCATRGRQGKVIWWAVSVPIPGKPDYSYCIDGRTVWKDNQWTTAKLITGNLKGIVCK